MEQAQEKISFTGPLKPLSDEMQALLTSHLQAVGDNLVRCAVSQCNSAFSSDSAVAEQLRKAIEAQSLFPTGVVQSAVLDNASLLLMDKFNEISTGMCRQVCDSVLKELVQSLTNIYKALVRKIVF